MTPQPPRVISSFVAVAVIAPAVTTGVAVALQLMAATSLPDPIAIHWGLSGAADGWGPAWLTLLLTVGVGLGLPWLLAASAVVGLRRGDRGPVYRLLAAIAAATSVFLAALSTGSVLIQQGISAAADAPSIVPVLGLAGALAVITGLGGWLLQPAERSTPSTRTATMDPPLGSTERAVWARQVRLARGGLVVLGGALLLLVAVSAITIAVSDNAAVTAILLAVVVLMVATIAMTVVFQVRVDATGLAVASAAGFPRVHIPLSDIERVEVVDVSPMGEFGGWGLRWAPGGGFGVVMRSGPGIRVHRVGGKVFTVTVDDAETGAALLSAERERTEPNR